MKRIVLVCGVLLLAACEGGTLGGSGGNGAFREFMVIGNSMTFEQCRARGGLIIRDNNSPMVACDPTIRRTPVPADEFDNPSAKPAS